MALASKKSTLNPNAPLFVPASFRQVEDFSPEWWDLITTSTWFHDYWLSQHSEDGEFTSVKGANDIDMSEVSDLLPDTFFLGAEDFMNLEFQFEEFIQSSESEGDIASFLASKDTPGSATGLEIDVVAQMKNLSLANSPKEKSSRLIHLPGRK